MYELRAFSFLVASCVVLVHAASAQGSWNTLTGSEPLVVARGGFSGLFPDSSLYAYQFAQATSQPSTVLWCDLQLTKDGIGICLPDIKLNTCTTIYNFFPEREKTYLVNGVPESGYFSIDFTSDDLSNVTLVQWIYSRTPLFDGSLPILHVEDVASFKPPGLWLNIQHDAFFTQHNLSMRSYVLSVSKNVIVNYISSPEVNFLKSITTRFTPKITKLVFRFLLQDDVEPSTNQTYGTLLKNLTFIKTFASGILVPKTYIWPVDDQLYLQPHTSIVSDAHKVGLEVFASDFANDSPLLSYNYSFDPLAEYVSFIDNGEFSVDGVLSDFPITPSAAIGCYSHAGNVTGQAKPLVISHNGASGDYPGCTDLAYSKAISDGTDILDCPVQITKDGIPICLASINLIDSTSAAESPYNNLTKIIPEISGTSGIYTFDLTWDNIQSLTPQISNPYYGNYQLVRNPKFKNAGNFVALSDFLALAKNASSVSGVLIGIENAAYLSEKQGINITNAVITSLSKAGYDNQNATKVMIQSTDSSVLQAFKSKANYKRVYMVDEVIRDALNSTVEEIKSFANSVAIQKKSVYAEDSFLTSVSNVVAKLHSFNLPVYVQLFRNEFVSQAWDFFSDATVEINTYVQNGEIDGIITDFPKTAASYKKNKCLDLKVTPVYMTPVQPGGLLTLLSPENLPPAEAPYPVLTDPDVSEAPLPPVSTTTDTANA